MKTLSTEQLKQIKGGFTGWALVGAAFLVGILAGIVDGYIHPKSCGGEEI